MMADEQKLATWLIQGHESPAGSRPPAHTSWAAFYAHKMATDPQGIVDALVEAGVLRRFRYDFDGPFFYAIVPPEPPHVHEWKVVGVVEGNADADAVDLACQSCPTRAAVANRLPIEVPSV